MSSELTIANLMKLANDNAIQTGGDMDIVRRIIAENDLVVALWPDSARPEGIDLIVIKGADILREVAASQQTYRGKITALKMHRGHPSRGTTARLRRGRAAAMKRAALPARYPPTGAWPAVMRADMAAAYLDYQDVAELRRTVARGEAPPPSDLHGTGRKRQPVWWKSDLDRRTQHVGTMIASAVQTEDLARLV
jgi:hypothetical protein